MDKMIGYIFNTLQDTEDSVKFITKVLKRQQSFNRNVVAFAGFTLLYICVNEHERKKQNEKIKALSEEIEELKNAKGE